MDKMHIMFAYIHIILLLLLHIFILLRAKKNVITRCGISYPGIKVRFGIWKRSDPDPDLLFEHARIRTRIQIPPESHFSASTYWSGPVHLFLDPNPYNKKNQGSIEMHKEYILYPYYFDHVMINATSEGINNHDYWLVGHR
mgnify:CR=1 FL=1